MQVPILKLLKIFLLYNEERSTEEAIQFMTREISCAKPDDFLWLDDTMLEKAGYRTCKNGNITKLGGK